MRGLGVILLAALIGCSGQSKEASRGDSSASGGSGGSGGAISFKECGNGVPCSPGATCTFTGWKGSSLSCTCDESNHFFCKQWFGGGGGPGPGCDDWYACSAIPDDSGPTSCTHTNGYCTRSCECDAGCSDVCDGEGPATGPVYTCDETCGGKGWGACQYSHASCSYQVQCAAVAQPEVTGSCP